MRDGVTPLAADYFNPMLADIDARIAALEDKRADLQGVIDDLTAFGLSRIDTLIGPAMETLNAALADALAQRDALAETVAAIGDLATSAQLADAVAAEAAARQQAIAQATAQPSSAEYAYDANGRVATIHESLPGGVRTTTIQYDAHGRVSSIVAEYGGVTRATSYTYDNSGAVIGFDVTEENNV
jgi:YD repeat-containing protein